MGINSTKLDPDSEYIEHDLVSSPVDVTPKAKNKIKIPYVSGLFLCSLVVLPFLYGGRSDLAASSVRLIFFSFFALRMVLVTVSSIRKGEGYAPEFFLNKEAYAYFYPFIPILAYILFQVVPLPISVLNYLSPLAATSYSFVGLDFGYISLEPQATINGFLWVLMFALLFAELMSVPFSSLILSSRRRRSRRTKRSAHFSDNSRKYDKLSELLRSVLIYTAFICSVVAIFHLASGYEALFNMFSPDVIFLGHSRAHWPFVSPNHLAIILEIGLLLSFTSILRNRQLKVLTIEVKEEENTIKSFFRFISQWESQTKDLIIFLIILLGLFLSGSRAGILLSVFALSLVWLFYRSNPVRLRSVRSINSRSRKSKKYDVYKKIIAGIVFPVVLVLIALLFLGDSSRNQLASRVEQGVSEGLDFGRRELKRISFNVFSESPLFGVGLNSWKRVAPQFASPELAPWELDYAHNEYLQFLAELGLFGFFIALFASFKGLVVALKKSRTLISESGIVQVCYFWGLLAAFLVPVFHAFVDFPFHMPATFMFVFASLVLLLRNVFSQQKTLDN